MQNYLVYLAGPITGLTYDDCTDWRQKVKTGLDVYCGHIYTLSPMRGKQRLKEIESNSTIKDCYEDNPLTTAKGINTRDFFDCKRSDLILVNLLGAKKVSIGTVMEIAWARAFNKPVVCVMEKDNVHRHSMLEYACGFIVETLDEAIDTVISVLGPDIVLDNVEIEADGLF